MNTTRVSEPAALAPRAVSLRRPAGIAAAGKALEIASLCLLVTLVPRALGPSDYGVFAVATSIVTIGSVTLALGGPVLMARFVPMVPEPDRPALARALALRTARWRGCLLGIAAIVVAAVAAARPDSVSPLTAALLLVALCIDAAATILLQMTLALQRIIAWSLRYPVQNVTLVAAVLALGTTLGRTGILTAILVSTVAALVVGLAATHRVGTVPRWNAALPDGVTRFSILQGLGSGAMVLCQRGGVIAVSLLGASGRETGFAAIAIGIALALCFAGVQPFVAELPRLAELGAAAPARAEHEIRRLAWIVLAGLAAVSTLTAALGSEILRVAAGSDYKGARDALVVALMAVPFAATLGALTSVSALHLRAEARLVALAAGLVTTATVAALLVPGHGAVGGAAAFAAGAVATGILGCVLLPAGVSRRLLAACAVASGLIGGVGLIA